MENPKCHNVFDQSLLAPPLAKAFDELHLSTVSLIANASSNASGQCSHGSLEIISDSPRISSATSNHSFFSPHEEEEISYFNQKPAFGSCTILSEAAISADSTNIKTNTGSLNLNLLRRLRHNSASPTIASRGEEMEPMKFNSAAPEALIAHPKPCHVLHINVINRDSDPSKEQEEKIFS